MIIVVSHQKGGVGKSTVAFNLATMLQKTHKVNVIDLDVQHTVTHTNKLRIKNKYKSLDIMYINNDKDFKKFVKKDNDEKLTIIDSGGFDSSLNRLAIYYADFVITPVSDRFNEISGLMKYKEILKELKELTNESIEVNILLNNINPNVKKFTGLKTFIKNEKSFLLMDSILRQRVDYDKAAWLGMNVKEFKKDSKATKEFKAFVKELKIKMGI